MLGYVDKGKGLSQRGGRVFALLVYSFWFVVYRYGGVKMSALHTASGGDTHLRSLNAEELGRETREIIHDKFFWIVAVILVTAAAAVVSWYLQTAG